MTLRHVEQSKHGCNRCWADRRYCGTPTPDPTSPCGWDGCMDVGHSTAECLHVPKPDCHPYLPTRCVCGHALEEQR